MLDGFCAPKSWPRTSSAQSSLPERCHGPQPDLDPGISPRSGGPTRWTSFYLLMSCSSSAAAHGLHGRRSGERRARRDADRGNLKASSPRCSRASFGPRRADDQQVVTGPTPRRHQQGHPLSDARPQVSDDPVCVRTRSSRRPEVSTTERNDPVITAAPDGNPPARRTSGHPAYRYAEVCDITAADQS